MGSPFLNKEIREKTEKNSENGEIIPFEQPYVEYARSKLNDKLVNGQVKVSIVNSDQGASAMNGYVNNFGALNRKKSLMAKKSERQ